MRKVFITKGIVVGLLFLFIASFLVIQHPENSLDVTKSLNVDDNKQAIISDSTSTTFDNGSLSGFITDSNMNPISGAIITITCGDITFGCYSDDCGYYRQDNIPIIFCIWNITVFKPGYEIEYVEMPIGENTTRDFVLKPSPSLFVNDDNTEGPWDGSMKYPYRWIQDAIDTALAGNIIYVYAGTYNENLRVDKSLQLIGENRTMTIIDGGGKRDVVRIMTDGVTLMSFTIKNGGSPFGSAGGVKLDMSSHSIISNNIIVDNDLYGIWVLENTSSHTTISRNIISGNGDDEYGGFNIWLYQSSYNTISNNSIQNGKGYGLGICFWSTHTTVRGNVISGNHLEGIKSRYGYNNRIYGNTIENNGYFGIRFLNASANNVIENNNFIGNKPMNAFFTITDANSSNQWDGNYWSRSRTLPKPIMGYIRSPGINRDMIGFPWLNFDMHPAQESHTYSSK